MSPNPAATATAFAAERARLLGIAYRMLGSRADAEDVLQDAWLRWNESGNADVRSTQAWLTTIVTRLSIDRLRSAKAQREVYIGPWLPEPLADIDPVTPESTAELASELSLAFLNLLERLGPDERAAFVLHDAFDCDYDDIAEVLGKSPAACRQLVHRARERVIAERRRFEVDEQTRRRMLERFIEVANAGDLPAIKALFATDARLVTDGGGKAVAVRRILHGAERIAQLFKMIFRRNASGVERRIVRVNGELGLATSFRGRLHSVTTIDTDGRRIYAYYSVANPDKLGAFLPRA
ncbi:RNA polymerase sigma-70 factor [Peristeroidobacter soli]|jgi:RNA polymerase sigma-70 factor (ECF subfamily)|uniref:RNA polymerase sigma-70 factor n=1 Tax=Peristeroidobacter soli TaxID=2497877 RepID=UPI00101D88B4|nr:RNA polymerase sigma-70 factor [Peristeroidobacter soli]